MLNRFLINNILWERCGMMWLVKNAIVCEREITQYSRVGDVSDEQYLVIRKVVSDVRD